MKAILVAALVATASAGTLSCMIPQRYTTVDAATKCTGTATGYLVWGFCVGGAQRNVLVAAPNQVRETLASKVNAFIPNAAVDDQKGCAVPIIAEDWNSMNPMMEGLTNDATRCDAKPAADATDATLSQFKGVEIWCDRAAKYFPIQGNEGSNICADAAANVWPANGVTPGAPYWVDPTSAFAPLRDAADQTSVSPNAVIFDPANTNSLLCSTGCLLPTNVCVPGKGFHANIVSSGNQFDEATCTLLPLPAGWAVPAVADNVFGTLAGVGGLANPVPGVTFAAPNRWSTNYGIPFVQWGCRTAFGASPLWTAVCVKKEFNNAAEAATITPAYTGQCGGVDGCATVPLWTTDAEAFAAQKVVLGDIRNFPEVTSTLTRFDLGAKTAYASLWTRRYWNNNPVQQFQNGNAFTMAVNGCAGVNKAQCIQQTANWWRCMDNFPGGGGTLCWMDTTEDLIFPTYELGFRCPSSSKKGLLGLLGLIGILPLLLLCCCLFFLCCIRRRKTETDVHFATFDPHAAPVLGATATACPTAFGATPYATHPSAIPVL